MRTTGLSEEFVVQDLTVVGAMAGGGGLGDVDLVYQPEPTSAFMVTIGLVVGLPFVRRVECGAGANFTQTPRRLLPMSKPSPLPSRHQPVCTFHSPDFR